jgi:REP element-mobilizing transposase RayT
VNEQYAQEWPQFFTATIQQWKHLLKEDTYKNIVVAALKFLVSEGKVTINGFVIMSNHLHIIWQAKGSNSIQKIQTSFIKHTSKEFKKQLEKDNKLKEYEVNAIDRKYNFWQRDSLNIELFTAAVFHQKLNYIHYNPVKAGLCNLPEEYYFSSAKFYENGIDDFGFIEHYLG